jgi:hypothetical protein
MGDDKVPEGWTSRPLGDPLPPEAAAELGRLLAMRAGGWEPPHGQSWARLILGRVTSPHAAALEAKGVDARFLAYAIEARLFNN